MPDTAVGNLGYNERGKSVGCYKDRIIQEQDQKWSFSEKSICDKCLSDPYLKSIVRDETEEHTCDFCETTTDERSCVGFNRIMEVIAKTVFQYFAHADEHLSYDREDGCYMGASRDTSDLFFGQELSEISDDTSVIDEVESCLGSYDWCDKNPYSLMGLDLYQQSWEAFCHAVKHQTRYFFQSGHDDLYTETIAVPKMLGALRRMIEGSDMLATLKAGEAIFRVRNHSPNEICSDWKSLGSPPAYEAGSNRMSPAGISMFYAGLDMETAKAEIEAHLKEDDQSVLTGGRWATTRDLRLLDLTKLPPAPSIFEMDRHYRDQVVFLRRFVNEITKPVAQDGMEHIDYVPTQILTEYFRHITSPYREQVQGIIYPSAQKKSGKAAVLFFDETDLKPEGRYGFSLPPLTFDASSVRRWRREDGRWSSET